MPIKPKSTPRIAPKVAPKIAIVHDWLVKHRGGERVLDAILELFPSADVFTLFSDPNSFKGNVGKHTIHTSWMNRLPYISHYYQGLLPLMPLAVESLNLGQYDLVLSTSHCVAKGVLTRPGSTHLSYCLTPARYAWDLTSEYLKGGISQTLAHPFLHYFRQWDALNSQRVDQFATTSHWVRQRIHHFYRRDATVIPAFADLDRYQIIPGDRGKYYLVVSALVPYKRIDLAIKACEALRKKLIIVGIGSELEKLRSLAGPHTVFLGNQSDVKIAELYAGAQALLFPGLEDFGIVPIEAMACGTPVIAYGYGGVIDTVVEGETGLFFREQTVEALTTLLLEFDLQKTQFDPHVLRQRALHFGRSKFKNSFSDFVLSNFPDAPIATHHLAHHAEHSLQ